MNNAKAHARKLNIVSLADKAEDKKTDEEAMIDVVRLSYHCSNKSIYYITFVLLSVT